MDVFGYCYFGGYTNGARENSSDFNVRVMYHLLLYDVATYLDIPGLVLLSADNFVSSFTRYCEICSPEQRIAALKICFSTNVGFQQVITLLQDTALGMFRSMIDGYKKDGKFKEALELMEAVPIAAAKLYSRPSTHEEYGSAEVESDQGETEDEDGEQ